MPTYEYECPSCGTHFEELRTISERDRSPFCAVCGANIVRVFSSPYLLSGAHSGQSRATEPTGNGIEITNCTFEDSPIGISLPEGSNATIKGNKFKNVKTPVEFRKK